MHRCDHCGNDMTHCSNCGHSPHNPKTDHDAHESLMNALRGPAVTKGSFEVVRKKPKASPHRR